MEIEIESVGPADGMASRDANRLPCINHDDRRRIRIIDMEYFIDITYLDIGMVDRPTRPAGHGDLGATRDPTWRSRVVRLFPSGRPRDCA